MSDQVHFASQYLAAAGKSFLEHKDDDSHTNLGYNIENQQLETWPLNRAGLKLFLDLNRFSLNWTIDSEAEIALNGKSHEEVVDLLKKSAIRLGFEDAYEFDLHYELPFDWDSNYTYDLSDEQVLHEISRLRTLANESLHTFLVNEDLHSDIRIWPHHFDTGAFVQLQNSDTSVGMGMAIPDSMVDDHYFYISGYKGHEGIDTSNFRTLNLGEWKNEGFKGAVLRTSGISMKQATQFLQEAFQTYKMY